MSGLVDPILFIFHNIDGVNFANREMLEFLSMLAKHPKI